MRFFSRRRAVFDPARLHEHEAVRDLAARLLAAVESLPVVSGAAGARPDADMAPGVAFLFSSLREGQGTSTIAAAVARALAESGRATLLALVAPTAAAADTADAVRLSEIVGSPGPLRFGQPPLLTVHVPPRLTDLPEAAHDPRAWAEGYRFLIIDAPPLTSGLTRYWVPKVPGVVLVVDGEMTAVQAVVQAREDLQRIGGRLVGVVLNRYRSRIPRWLAPYFVYG